MDFPLESDAPNARYTYAKHDTRNWEN